MNILGIALALMVAQASDLPGPADTTFEQRWDSMVIKHQLKKDAGEIPTPRAEHKEAHRHREKRHRHSRSHSKCRYGSPVYHGRSWRCRR